VEVDPWGLPYKLVIKKLFGKRSIPGLKLPGRVDTISNGLFPRDVRIEWPPRVGNLIFPEVTSDEIREVSWRILSGEVPGPDGFPDVVIKVVATRKPEVLRDTFNECLKCGLFPRSWKVAKLSLLRKGEKPLEHPSSHRPICLLNTVGKLFERIIKRRLQKQLEESGDLSELQFGFRKGRSVVDALK